MGLDQGIGDQAFCSAQTLGKGDEGYALQDLQCRLPAVHGEAEGAAPASGLSGVDGVARVVRQPDVIDLFHPALLAQPPSQGECGLLLPLHADSQGFHAPEDQPAVEGGESIAYRLGDEPHPVCQILISSAEKAGNSVVMTAQELAAAVQDDVRTQGNGVLEIGGEEGVVRNEQRARLLCQGGAARQIGDVHHGVAGRLHIDGPGAGPQGGADSV